MKKTGKFIIIFITILMTAANLAWAQDERFEASMERTKVSVGNPVYLYLTFHGARDVDTPDVPDVNGLQIKYIGPATEVSIVNGKVSKSITHTYLVIARKGGEYELGPYSVGYKNKIYRTNILIFSVSDTPLQKPSAAGSPRPVPGAATGGYQQDEQTFDFGDKLFLDIEVGKRKVYVNETVPLTITVGAYEMGLKDIEFPVFKTDGFSTGEFEQPEQSWKMVRGLNYKVLVFRQDLYAIKEGEHIIGPAVLRAKAVTRKQPSFRASIFGIDEFFAGRFGHKVYPVELTSGLIPVTILPFPEEGKPRDFQGAVGNFSMDVNIEPRKVKVGDPVTLRITIRGEGNLDTVTAPRLLDTEDLKTYEPQVSKEGNKKTYEQILIPKSVDLKKIPEVTFSFFDPKREKYQTLKRGPFPIEVLERPESERVVKMVSMPGVEQMLYPQEELGQDIIHIKESTGRLQRRGSYLPGQWLFWIGQIIPLMLFVSFYTVYSKKKRMSQDKSYARFLKAPKRARKGLQKAKTYLARKDMLSFYDAIFKTLQEYLGGRLNIPRGNVTIQVIRERLRPAGCDEEILSKLEEVFSKCEMARYASSIPEGAEAYQMMEDVKKITGYLERIKI
ncbi:MAG: protein BatD [Candidatus Omnitrophica bacterium]|nr:protein BatD [Candidatus Omnitrophota bacterium]